MTSPISLTKSTRVKIELTSSIRPIIFEAPIGLTKEECQELLEAFSSTWLEILTRRTNSSLTGSLASYSIAELLERLGYCPVPKEQEKDTQLKYALNFVRGLKAETKQDKSSAAN